MITVALICAEGNAQLEKDGKQLYLAEDIWGL